MLPEFLNKIQETQNKLAKAGFPAMSINSKITKLSPGYAGMAYPIVNAVYISPDYLKEYPEQVLNVTVPHEVCHLYVDKYFPKAKQSHGPEFRFLMSLLGLPGKTYHSMKLSQTQEGRRMKTRYIYISQKTKKEIQLTSHQHSKIQGQPNRYSWKGELLVWSGKKVQFK